MAEVVSKKTINVVSTNKKNNEVCSVVQSNNGLDNITTTCSSNNQLISLCDKNDDDEDELLVLANNTRNELDSDEKSLQELIESELALRICSTNQATDPDVHMDPESSLEEQLLVSEVKRIVLDPCRQDENRITADFIANEVQHCLIEPYSYQNGHTFSENIEPFQNFDQQLGEEMFAEPEISDITVVHKTNNTDSNDRSTSCDDVGLLSHDDSDLEDHHGSNLPLNDTDQTDECSKLLNLVGESNDSNADKSHFSTHNENFELQTEDHSIINTSDGGFVRTSTHSTEYSNTWNPQDMSLLHDYKDQIEIFESSESNDVFSSASVKKEESEFIEICESELKIKTSEIVVQKEENQFDCSPDSVSTEEFIDTERRVLNEESPLEFQEENNRDGIINTSQIDSDSKLMGKKETEIVERSHHSTIDQQPSQDSQNPNFDCWITVEELTNSQTTFSSREIVNSSSHSNQTVPIVSVTETEDEYGNEDSCISSPPRAPLATPDDETSDLFNTCDSETREETITTTSSLVTTSSKTSGTKTKKKKIEGVTGNDTSPNLTPRIKKTKKNKKNELEKENISVNCNLQDLIMHTGSRQLHPEMINFSNEDDLSNVDVKSLTQNYVSETIRNEQERSNKERIATGISIKELCRSFVDISNMNDADQTIERTNNLTVDNNEKSSFNKFDALSKKNILHVRSVDAGKVQQQLNAVGQNGDTNPNCRSCGKVVFQMEQTKAEGLAWHKNCFRCVQCSKQLNVDNYESHESTLYCKAHFKELFQPKPVEETDQPASDKPDLGLEELSNLNVKSRFQVFEKANESTNEIEKSPSQVAVKRSPSILSKLAKFQAKGMDIGVADESLNGIPYEESSESEEEEEETEETEEVETEIIKAKRTTRERPISFSKMDDIKNRWETTTQQGRRETQREARKEEIAGIRSRLFMGKQGKMKEMYQQAVAESERVTKINAAEEIQHTIHARSIKERFERGEPIVATSDDEGDSKPKVEKADEEVIAAGISRKSRSLFLELDASAAKTGRPITPVNPKTPSEGPRRARDMDSPEREIYRDPDVVRADDRINEVVHTDTARKMLSIFRQMEENAAKEELPDGPKPLKRFTPPPEDKFAKQTASESDEDEDEEEAEESEGEESGEDKDPNYVRASDKVEDEFLKQAQTAARAKALRAKFEHWEETDGKVTNHNVAEMEIAQSTVGDQSSIESASSLRARFESLGSQTNEQTPRTPKVKVNRFVEIQSSCMDACESCEKRVYPLEKVETNNKIFHKQCFRCLQCNCILRMDTFTLNNGKLYCIPHFKQLFITRGNYDEGFGVDPHKNKWSANGSATILNVSPIVVSNGDV